MSILPEPGEKPTAAQVEAYTEHLRSNWATSPLPPHTWYLTVDVPNAENEPFTRALRQMLTSTPYGLVEPEPFTVQRFKDRPQILVSHPRREPLAGVLRWVLDFWPTAGELILDYGTVGRWEHDRPITEI